MFYLPRSWENTDTEKSVLELSFLCSECHRRCLLFLKVASSSWPYLSPYLFLDILSLIGVMLHKLGVICCWVSGCRAPSGCEKLHMASYTKYGVICVKLRRQCFPLLHCLARFLMAWQPSEHRVLFTSPFYMLHNTHSDTNYMKQRSCPNPEYKAQ